MCLIYVAGLVRLEASVVIHEIMYHPATEHVGHEWIELHNAGAEAVEVGGWRLEGGVRLTLPIDLVVAPGGFLVLCADSAAFAQLHPKAPLAVGNWEGRLSNRADTIELLDTGGRRVDRVRYADEGDWAQRRQALPSWGHRGWEWVAAHDGGGRTLERVNLRLPGDTGQNWRASLVDGGTPFAANSVAQHNSPPLVLDVLHDPVLPGPQDAVAVRARVIDEAAGGVMVELSARATGEASFATLRMFDDGQHRDGLAGDGWFGAVLAARPAGVVVEFFIEAIDGAGLRRVFPAPVVLDGGVEAQSANLLYQVEGTRPAADLPLYRLILTEAERAELATIGSVGPEAASTSQMNATFICQDASGLQVRYRVGVRNRGHGSRAAKPNNYRVNFAADALWKNVGAINLNGQAPASQVVGSALFQQLGVPAAPSRAVRVLVNGTNLAAQVAGHPGYHAHNDVYDSDLAAKLFPGDPSGNLYRGVRLVPPGADLSYRGDLGILYEPNYPKGSNASENDYSDLIALTRALSPLTPNSEYVATVGQVLQVDSWLRYFALNTLLDNNETNPSNGDGDDYQLYSGLEDRRFYLLPRDLDTILGAPGVGGGVESGLFRATRLVALDRFLKQPEFARGYYAELDRLARGGFAPERVGAVVDQVLGASTPAGITTPMKDFASRRVAFVLAAIPRELSVTNQVPDAMGRVRALSDRLELAGFADPILTHAVEVDGRPATWSAWEGRWRATMEGLAPGQHRIRIRALGDAGVTVDSREIELWREAPATITVAGTLTGGAVWNDVGVPYLLAGAVVVPAGQTLKIDPGVTVWVEPGSVLVVEGRVEARGDPGRRIRLARHPTAGAARTNSWEGIVFAGASQTNVLRSVDLEDAGSGGRSIYAVGSVLMLEDVTFAGTTTTLVEILKSSFQFRDCRFPSLDGRELIHGGDIPPGGFARIEGCVFGTTTGFNDIVDFSRARRPGPVLEVRGNLFTGASDDVLDLDGCDAHVEGNVFLHVSNGNPAAPDTSSAISFGADGGYAPHVVAVRNIFHDVDHVALVKEGGFLTLEHNTLFECRVGAVNFSEPKRGVLPGRGGRIAHNILWATPVVFENLRPSNGVVTVTVERNALAGSDAAPWAGSNFLADPALVGVASGLARPSDGRVWREAMRLRRGSLAVGAAFGGLDLGADVPGGVAVSAPPGAVAPGRAEFSPISQVREAVFDVAGPGIVGYRFRIGEGAFGEWIPIDQSIRLLDLPSGTNRVEVVGMDSAGVSREETRVVREWIVAPEAPAWPLMVEVLASNRGALRVGERFPDLVELYNPWPVSAPLGGVWLRFEGRRRTNEFRFDAGAPLSAGGRQVVILAEPDSMSQGDGGFLTAGFALDAEDGRLMLGRGATVIDMVSWGRALVDVSFVRQSTGRWTLGQPSLGQPNRPVSLGDPRGISLNEWGVAGARDFVELYNPSALPVDLGGMRLSDQPWTWRERGSFPPFTLIAAEALLVLDAREDEGVATRLGFGLPNDSGSIGLLDAAAVPIDVVVHGAQHAGGSEGRTPSGSVVVRRFAVATPGAPNPAREVIPLVLNEVLANNQSLPDAAGRVADFIELHNRGTAAVDAGGLGLTDDPAKPYRWQVVEGTLVPAGGLLLVQADSERPVGPRNTGFGLNASGETVYLFDATARGGALLDALSLGLQAPDYSVGRTGTGVGADAGWQLGLPTPGEPNRSVALGDTHGVRINEWMAEPIDGEDWFELFNPGPLPVLLTGTYLSDDPANPYQQQIPALSFLGPAPGGFVRFVADGLAGRSPGHVNFRLRSEGESIVFTLADGRTADAVRFAAQRRGVSQGRYPDGADAWLDFPTLPSPGRPNEADTDGDGLGDDWEERFGLDRLSAHDAHVDADGDGLTNREEFLAGTDPRAGSDLPRIVAVEVGTEGVAVLIEAQAGRSYELWAATAPVGVNWERVTTAAARGVRRSLRLEEPGVPERQARFYRILVGRE